jgi:hypothetical protein
MKFQLTGQRAMEPKLIDLYDKLKKSGLTPEQDQKIQLELNDTPPQPKQNHRHRRFRISTLFTI